jgi:hypothetical protein
MEGWYLPGQMPTIKLYTSLRLCDHRGRKVLFGKEDNVKQQLVDIEMEGSWRKGRVGESRLSYLENNWMFTEVSELSEEDPNIRCLFESC